jgi:hypothetical protein
MYNSSGKIELQHNSNNGLLSRIIFRYLVVLIIKSTHSILLVVQLFNIHIFNIVFALLVVLLKDKTKCD